MSLDVSAYDALFPSGIGPDVIEQIPLGQTVFPFKDLDASGRMIRQPLYGDDIIPVSALVVGQHPTTGDAQTVDTDGHHRLLVSGGSGSSSGITPVAMTVVQYLAVTLHGGGIHIMDELTKDQITTLYGFSYSYRSSGNDTNNSPVNQDVTYYLQSSEVSGTKQITYLHRLVPIKSDQLSPLPDQAYNGCIMFPTPLDIASMYDGFLYPIEVVIDGGQDPSQATIGLYYAPAL